MRFSLILIFSLIFILLLFLIFPKNEEITIATTTSVYATGLLDSLIKEFKKDYPNINVKATAVGTGQALELAKRGEVDIVIVHSPSAEKEYSEFLTNGYIFAYNSFIIVGPKENNLQGKNELEIFKKIFEEGEKVNVKFVSRGDKSGTHQREILIWEKLNLDPFNKPWYLKSGSGMDITLRIADEKSAFTLSDFGTYFYLKDSLPHLKIFLDKGDLLLNIYSIYLVKGHKSSAEYFYNFVKTREDIIKSFYPLFLPPYKDIKEDWERLSRG